MTSCIFKASLDCQVKSIVGSLGQTEQGGDHADSRRAVVALRSMGFPLFA